MIYRILMVGCFGASILNLAAWQKDHTDWFQLFMGSGLGSIFVCEILNRKSS